MVPDAQHIPNKGENVPERMELGWQWTRDHLGDLIPWVNECHARGGAEEFSQPFFRSLVLRSLLRAPSSTANAISTHNGSNDLSPRY
jgi:hypothetical protein